MSQTRLCISLYISLLLTLSIVFLSTSQQQCTNPNQVRAGYWFSNSNHYSPLTNINSSLYTHIYYYSLSIDKTLAAVALPPANQVVQFVTFSKTLKSTNPSLKTILSISTDTPSFSSIVSDQTQRKTFINSTMDLARANRFDGLDLSWQFPSSSADMANLALLLTEWRSRIDDELSTNSSPPLLLTATLYFSNHIFDTSNQNLYYPIDSISYNLDWANILSFGFRKTGNDLTVTAFDAPLYDKASHYSLSYGIISWIDSGLPPCKIVMGLPLYGKSWFLRNKVKNGIGAPVVAAGPKQRISNQSGLMSFNEIQEMLRDSNNAVSIYDNVSVAAYFYSSNLWVSFDSLQVIEEKIKFAVRNQLLGYFLWPISFDDANYTVSKQASAVWLKYHDSPYYENGIGFNQSPALFNSPPQHNAQSPSIANRSTVSHLLFFSLVSSILLTILNG